MDAWVIWLLVAVALVVGEALTLTAVAGLLAAASALTAVAATLGVGVAAQLTVFGTAAITSVALLRPLVRGYLNRPDPEPFGMDALIGAPGYALERVSHLGGRVRIGGEEWTARTPDHIEVIPAGTEVDVIRISGNTAIVYPREGPCSSQPN
jgi:membrane protein implicated in regulation of membrane protease activity